MCATGQIKQTTHSSSDDGGGRGWAKWVLCIKWLFSSSSTTLNGSRSTPSAMRRPTVCVYATRKSQTEWAKSLSRTALRASLHRNQNNNHKFSFRFPLLCSSINCSMTKFSVCSFLFSFSLAACAIWSCVFSRGRRRRHHHHRLNCSGWLKWVRLESVVIWFKLKQAVAATAESIIIIKTHLRAQSWPQSDFLSNRLRGHFQFNGKRRGSDSRLSLLPRDSFENSFFHFCDVLSSSDIQSVNEWLAVSACDWNVSALKRQNTFGFITCHCQLITEQSHRLYNSNFEMGKKHTWIWYCRVYEHALSSNRGMLNIHSIH